MESAGGVGINFTTKAFNNDEILSVISHEIFGVIFGVISVGISYEILV